MEKHIYCCNRCGTTFESETDEDYCGSCRALFRRSHPHTVAYEHTCKRCGRKYRSKSQTAKYCSDCRGRVQQEQIQRWSELNRSASAKPNAHKSCSTYASIAEICKLAQAEGMTYGEYVAKKGSGRV